MIECLCGETVFLVSRTIIVALVIGLIGGSRILCNIIEDSCKLNRPLNRMKPVLLLEMLDIKTGNSKDLEQMKILLLLL